MKKSLGTKDKNKIAAPRMFYGWDCQPFDNTVTRRKPRSLSEKYALRDPHKNNIRITQPSSTVANSTGHIGFGEKKTMPRKTATLSFEMRGFRWTIRRYRNSTSSVRRFVTLVVNVVIRQCVVSPPQSLLCEVQMKQNDVRVLLHRE